MKIDHLFSKQTGNLSFIKTAAHSLCKHKNFTYRWAILGSLPPVFSHEWQLVARIFPSSHLCRFLPQTGRTHFPIFVKTLKRFKMGVLTLHQMPDKYKVRYTYRQFVPSESDTLPRRFVLRMPFNCRYCALATPVLLLLSILVWGSLAEEDPLIGQSIVCMRGSCWKDVPFRIPFRGFDGPGSSIPVDN